MYKKPIKHKNCPWPNEKNTKKIYEKQYLIVEHET